MEKNVTVRPSETSSTHRPGAFANGRKRQNDSHINEKLRILRRICVPQIFYDVGNRCALEECGRPNMTGCRHGISLRNCAPCKKAKDREYKREKSGFYDRHPEKKPRSDPAPPQESSYGVRHPVRRHIAIYCLAPRTKLLNVDAKPVHSFSRSQAPLPPSVFRMCSQRLRLFR